MSMNSYIRTDIASERVLSGGKSAISKKYTESGFTVHETEVTESEDSGFGAGHYITVDVGAVWNLGREDALRASSAVSAVLSRLCKPFISSVDAPVLTVCLGNRRITSDALGPLCADKMIVTRHIKSEKPSLFEALGGRETALITPGVTGDTGIEAYDMIYSAARTVDPCLIICVDALASRSIDRLATTVQLSDGGISPGSGVGNHRREISRRSLGIPVISVGVPTVVHSSTLVIEALEKAGITEISDSLRSVLENERSYFVTLKEADTAVGSVAELIARAINTVFLGFPEL